MPFSDTWRSLATTLLGEPEFTAPEVACEAGVDVEQARHLWRALGFPPVPDAERIFTRSDVAMLRAVRDLVDRRAAAPDVLLQLTRVIGQSLARVAEAQVVAMADRRADAAPSAAFADIVSAIDPLLPHLEQFHSYVWRRHLLAALLRLAAATRTPNRAGHRLVVGFADLVGFTAISRRLDTHELAATVDRFEALAYEHILERGGRVVKMIGDEVMFTAEDALVGAEIALALVEAYAGDPALPDVRIGLAAGSTLSWEGDLFGPTVNLASRLVDLARPGTVLVSETLGKRLDAHPVFSLRHLRRLNLKGIGPVRSWVLRRRTASGE